MATPSTPVQDDFDFAGLDRLSNHNAEKFQKYALLFLHSMEDVTRQMETACETMDLHQLAAMGHRAKSTAMTIGATHMAANCLTLEESARNGNAAQALELSGVVHRQFLRVRTALEIRLQQQQALALTRYRAI